MSRTSIRANHTYSATRGNPALERERIVAKDVQRTRIAFRIVAMVRPVSRNSIELATRVDIAAPLWRRWRDLHNRDLRIGFGI
jgi:hypothetical protein